MRKPRDYDAELVALDAKAGELRGRKLAALGELVIATGADALPIDALAGALLSVATTKDASQREDWRQRGAAFFQRTGRGAAGKGGLSERSGSTRDDRAAPVAGDAGAS